MRRRKPTITQAQIEAMLDEINEFLKQPTEPYTMQPDGKLKANEGVFFLGMAYGGHRIEQMVNGGGIKTITHYDTKRATLEAASSLFKSTVEFDRTGVWNA